MQRVGDVIGATTVKAGGKQLLAFAPGYFSISIPNAINKSFTIAIPTANRSYFKLILWRKEERSYCVVRDSKDGLIIPGGEISGNLPIILRDFSCPLSVTKTDQGFTVERMIPVNPEGKPLQITVDNSTGVIPLYLSETGLRYNLQINQGGVSASFVPWDLGSAPFSYQIPFGSNQQVGPLVVGFNSAEGKVTVAVADYLKLNPEEIEKLDDRILPIDRIWRRVVNPQTHTIMRVKTLRNRDEIISPFDSKYRAQVDASPGTRLAMLLEKAIYSNLTGASLDDTRRRIISFVTHEQKNWSTITFSNLDSFYNEKLVALHMILRFFGVPNNYCVGIKQGEPAVWLDVKGEGDRHVLVSLDRDSYLERYHYIPTQAISVIRYSP